MDLLLAVVGSLAPSVPVLLVWTVGMGLALASVRRRPTRSLLLLVGLAVMTVLRLATGAFYGAIPVLVARQGWSAAQIGQLTAGVSVLSSLAYAVAWMLVLAAVFVREGPAEDPPG